MTLIYFGEFWSGVNVSSFRILALYHWMVMLLIFFLVIFEETRINFHRHIGRFPDFTHLKAVDFLTVFNFFLNFLESFYITIFKTFNVKVLRLFGSFGWKFSGKFFTHDK